MAFQLQYWHLKLHVHTIIDIPSCDTDPQPKTKTVTFNELDLVKIERITIKATDAAGVINIDQRKQPEGHRLELFPDGHMKFRGINNDRVYSISKQPGSRRGFTELTIQADCETTPK